MEGLFEGTISTSPPQTMYTHDPITWLDIVTFAKSNPSDFTLTAAPEGRSCQFFLKGVQVEITEDDWRLIRMGALDRFKLDPANPIEEDETMEHATLEILEKRLQVLIKKADEVARKARQLNYHLSGRKAAINSRRSQQQSPSSLGFQSVNQPGRIAGPNNGYDLHADLLQQFLAHNPPSGLGNRLSSTGSVPPTPGGISAAATTTSPNPRNSIQQQMFSSTSNRPSPSHHSEGGSRDAEEEHRALVTAKVEKLVRGDVIYPPCDRCKRLKTPCIKHLTACQGCTKKHARCIWRTITDEEVAWLKREAIEGDDGDDIREQGLGIHSAPDSHHGGDSETRRDSDRSEDAGSGISRSRIAIGRTPDDIWRKGEGTSSRQDSMDVDVDPKESRGPRPAAAYMSSPPDGSSLLFRMARAASAATDGAVPIEGFRPGNS
ncbi:hypothetical protein BX600DRAFT_113824 [Xylariales sp. PMI_506]|nr:hypothetical protein BX600DRAFT_113824 [Xylariales sp. PMI_506]